MSSSPSQKKFSDMVVPSRKIPVPEGKSVLPPQRSPESHRVLSRTEKKITPQLIHSEPKAREYRKEVRVQESQGVTPRKGIRILPYLAGLCGIILVIVLGGFFAHASLDITLASQDIPVDIFTTLTQDTLKNNSSLSFSTSTQTFMESAVVSPTASEEEMSQQAHLLKQKILEKNPYDRVMQKLARDIPSSFMVLPLSFYDQDPLITFEREHADGVHVVAQQTFSFLLVDRADYAKFILEHTHHNQSTIPYIVATSRDMRVMTQVLATPTTLPSSIPVRITGTAHLMGDDSFESLKAGAPHRSRRDLALDLTHKPEVSSFKIQLIPFWRTILPSNPEAISWNIHPQREL